MEMFQRIARGLFLHVHFRDTFEEGKHHRAANGEFGSGGGAAAAKPKGKSNSKIPFVRALVEEHGSNATIAKHLEGVPKEKLHAALGLLAKHGDASDPHDRALKKMVENELDDRANRGS